ncbi:MAG TPA: efflux RND transporter periplasmic adaptor subunit [Bacillota bacterium]|nr:efflux RND transporter periplasmic adaptor subunit [Bacillota bacterium]HPT86542.1 efflux RND transporter periplasmic adaptor subunit [Bacillota bacterium]
MNKKLIVIGIVLSLLLIAGCGRKKPVVKEEDPVVPVQVAVASSGDIQEIYSTTGTVEATSKTSVTSKISGRVAQIAVELGDYVSKGQTLVSLEKTDLINQLNQAKTSLLQAETNLSQIKTNFNRIQKLFAEQLVSQHEFDNAKTQYEIALNQVQQAQINVEMSEEQLRNTEIKAPISGYIGERKINAGEMATPGSPLMDIVDLSRVYVTIHLSDSYITQTKIGQKVTVRLPSLQDKTFSGTVYQISPAAQSDSKMFPVKILLDNSSRVFKDGMLAEVKMNFNERKNVIQIPIEAVIEETGTKAVFVIKDNQAYRKNVEVGINNGKFIEIISGININDQVVVLGQSNLEDGMKVVVK